jgi:hypothetical protein
MTNVTANTRRSLARRFNDILRAKPKPKKQKPAVCRCRRDNICHSCKGSMNRDLRYGDVRRGSDGRLHNVCASCMD